MPSNPQSRTTVPGGLPVEHLAAEFDDFRISSARQPGFVGGFMSRTPHGRGDGNDKPLPVIPSYARPTSDPAVPPSLRPGHGPGYQVPSSSGTLVIPPLPRPPQMHLVAPMPMPTPSLPSPHVDQSLTMMYARSAPPEFNRHAQSPAMPEPHSHKTTPYIRHQHHASVPSFSISTPELAPPRVSGRASSSPPSPSSLTSSALSPTARCGGTTKAGKRCNRIVKAPIVSIFTPDIPGEQLERFCFQHVKEILGQTGFYSHNGAGWIKFETWIPGYLQDDTRAALQAEMEKPSSPSDEPGYIYAYEIRDPKTPKELKIKVGRAVKLVKRLDQWSKQCTSKEVILRGWWPGTVEDDKGTNGTSLLRGRVKAGEKGPMCHRLERLVHLELADLAVHAPYLEPGFSKDKSTASETKVNGSNSAPSPGRLCKPKLRNLEQPCGDCGAIHKEIFTFKRVQKGKYKDKEWEEFVQPVIHKWGRFVRQYV